MQAHANDLRAEVAHDWKDLVEAPAQPDDKTLDTFVHQAAVDWRECPLRPAVRDLLAYAEKMTRTPWEMAEADVTALRQAGWSDRAVHDAVQVVSYFCYINRVADALGVDAETGRPTWGHE